MEHSGMGADIRQGSQKFLYYTNPRTPTAVGVMVLRAQSSNLRFSTVEIGEPNAKAPYYTPDSEP